MVSGAGTIATDDDRVAGDGPETDTRAARTPRRVTVEFAALLALVVFGIASRWIDADWPAVLPALQAIGTSLVPTAGIAALAAIGRRWRLVAVAVAVAALQLGLQLPWWVTGDQVVEATDDPFVAMTTNAAYGGADTDALVAAIARHDVDVLTVLEATAQLRDALAAEGIDAMLPHVIDRSYDGCVPVWSTDRVEPVDGCVSAAGSMIYSRYPLSDARLPAVRRTLFESPVAQVDTPDGPVVVLAAHPVPPWPGDTRLWYEELTGLAAWASNIDRRLPLVIAGDLNASEAHPALRRFAAAGLYDAHRQVGDGPVATWPRLGRFGVPLLPMFHLDHVLVRGLGVADAGTVPLPGTDHVAVWAALEPRP